MEQNLTKSQRSLCAQLHSGTLLLELNEAIEMFQCSLYADLRATFVAKYPSFLMSSCGVMLKP